MLPCHARCVLCCLCCNGHSVLLDPYLFRIGRIDHPPCSACGHSSQDTSHLILHCPATDSLQCSLFGDSLSIYDLWSRPWGVAHFLGLHGHPPCPIPRKGSSNQQQHFFCKELSTRTTANEVMAAWIAFTNKGIEWKKCVGVCTDGAASMTGVHRGVVKQIHDEMENAKLTHCFLLRQT